MAMRAKTHASRNFIIVQYSQHTEIHTFGVMVVSKTKCMVGIKPAMIGMAPAICFI